MDFNKILDRLGHFGRFQAFVYTLACLLQVFVGIHMLANVFLMGEPKHRCSVPNCDNQTSQYLEPWVSYAIPHIDNGDGEGSVPKSCEQYEQVPGDKSCVRSSFTNKTISCEDFVWDHSDFELTTVSEWKIVCKKSWEGQASLSVFMSGVLFGSAGFGIIADRFGRKTVVLSATMIMLASSIGTAFSPNLTVFSILRFITAAAVSGLFQTGYIIAVEFIGTSKRLLCANVMQIVFAVGELLLGFLAYFIRKWKTLQLALSIPAVILLAYYWLLPESVRWLISKGKHHKAKCTILKAARWNKKIIPEHLLRAVEYSDSDTETHEQPSGPLTIFRTPHLRKWSLNLFLNWGVNAMVYYGLSLSVGHLSGNIYFNSAILAAVEIPAVILATILLNYCGRRVILCCIMIFGGVACGGSVFIPQSLQWLSTTLTVLGKSAIAASFAIIYIYSAEIYPTIVRSTGIGLSSMFARIGGIIAPLINELRKVYRPLPMIIFAFASIIAGFLALALPETHNKQLPETIEESELLARAQENLIQIPRSRLMSRIGSISPRSLERRLLSETEHLLSPNA